MSVFFTAQLAACLTLLLSRDPTVRLELSSSINWMNRRSVLLAIQQGQLDIEPVPSETFLQEHATAQSGISGLGTGSNIICGLCGAFIMHDSSKSSGMFQRQLSLPANTWSTSLFMGRQNSRSTTPLRSQGSMATPTTIYIFRLAADSYNTPQPGRSRPMYPLCTSGWCLNRLRTTCNLWAFVRTGVMEKVWEEGSLVASRRTSVGETSSQSEPEKQQENSAPPPSIPPSRGRFGKLWERASSLGVGVVEKISTTEPEKTRKDEEDAKKLPSPPPEPEEPPPKRFVPPLPPARTRASVPLQQPRDQNQAEAPAPPAEELAPRDDGVLFEHDQHDHPQPAEPSPRPATSPVKHSEPVVEKPKPPVLPPRAPRHPPTDIVRPRTPSTIPLPDSLPSTPTTKAERRTSLPPTSTTLDPGRSSSPAPGTGGAPPPIPRRAPARVRPVSSRPSTPLNQPPVNSPEKKEGSEDSGVPPSITANEPANPTVEETVPPPVVEPVSRPEPEITKPIFTTENEKSDVEAIQIAKVSSPITAAEGSADSPVDEIQLTGGDGSGFIGNQNLVGDKLWQEKTWKEVVRLREEMFYARMGIVR